MEEIIKIVGLRLLYFCLMRKSKRILTTNASASALTSYSAALNLFADHEISKQKRAKILKNLPSTSKVNIVQDIENNVFCGLNDLEAFPVNVAEHLKWIIKMRGAADAPVDTMGCHMLADSYTDPKTYRFQILVALMLSSQTKDQVTSAAMERLKAKNCTIEGIIEKSMDELTTILYPVGFYKRKALYLKQTAEMLKEKFESNIPDTLEGLLSLPGVGPKMAYLALQIAFDKTEGIGVDTHVHRIANRLNWFQTKNPVETEVKLQAILPKTCWRSINKLLVGFGQQTCLPVNPKCATCLNRNFCPSASKKR